VGESEAAATSRPSREGAVERGRVFNAGPVVRSDHRYCPRIIAAQLAARGRLAGKWNLAVG
jgi:hypothetical protein